MSEGEPISKEEFKERINGINNIYREMIKKLHDYINKNPNHPFIPFIREKIKELEESINYNEAMLLEMEILGDLVIPCILEDGTPAYMINYNLVDNNRRNKKILSYLY